jgi:transposase
VGRPAGGTGQPLSHAAGHPPAGLDATNKSLAASERDDVARQPWREAAQHLEVTDLVCVDESGTHRAMPARSSRAPRGARAVGAAPRTRGRVTTLLASRSLGGRGAAMPIDGGTTPAVCEASVEQGLAPTLRPGQGGGLDNGGAPQRDTARRAIEARHCRGLFLPAYAPDCSPIEAAFSKIKAGLRRVEARTQAALAAAIGEALRTVTPADARGWFTQCGYPIPAQS